MYEEICETPLASNFETLSLPSLTRFKLIVRHTHNQQNIHYVLRKFCN
jgi:hypothetical protein